MQVYKLFLKIAKKNAPRSFVFLGVFMVLIVMMSFMGESKMDSTFEAEQRDIAIADYDDSEMSRALVEYLGEIHNIVPFDNYDSEVMQDNLFYERITYFLEIPAGFEGKLLEGETDDLLLHATRSDAAAGYFVNRQVDAYISSVRLYMAVGDSPLEAAEHSKEDLAKSGNVEARVYGEKSSGASTVFYYFQYMSYTLLMLFGALVTPVMITLHKQDLEMRMDVSAVSRRRRNLIIGLACISLTTAVWVVLIILAMALFGIGNVFGGYNWMLLLNSYLFTLIATAVALIMGSFNLQGGSLDMVNNIVALGMSFLCGIFVPQWLLGESILKVSRFLPAYWYIRINNMVAGFSGEKILVESFWKYFRIEALFAVAIFSIYLVIATNRKNGVKA